MLLILPNQYKVPKSISSSPLTHSTTDGVKYAKYFSHVKPCFISLSTAAKKSLGMMQIDLTESCHYIHSYFKAF